MAKLTDLSAELVYSIIDHVLHPIDPDQLYRPARNYRHLKSDVHHLLDHNQIEAVHWRPRAQQKPTPPYPPAPLKHYTDYLDNPNARIRAPKPNVSWPHGLPKNPPLPLALVSRTFRQCAQQRLFQHVSFSGPWKAHMFLQALSGSSEEDESNDTRTPTEKQAKQDARESDEQIDSSSEIKSPRLNLLARHVRSLQLAWGGTCSLDKGGGSLFCDIIRSCPLLENIVIFNATFLIDCKEPILEALASRRHIKEINVLANPQRNSSKFRWLVEEVVTRLFSKWDSLETIKFYGISAGPMQTTEPVPQSISVLNCPLRTMVLDEPQLDEKQLSALLRSCRESLRTLEINKPDERISRAGLCRIIQECTSPDLECLTLIWWRYEGPFSNSPGTIDSDDPDINPGMLDLIFKSRTALQNLKSLSFKGKLATQRLFELLPQSLIKIAWQDCTLPAAPLLEALWGNVDDNESLLPNLKCCSVRSRYPWEEEEQEAIEAELKARGGCFHSIQDPHYGSPTPSDLEEDELRDCNPNDADIDAQMWIEAKDTHLVGWS
ncbi:hypothetical protein Pst134EB_010060 [Puccinia striiformis f. sp. tritici]|nr:hypothetical protein Pst134EB_010060 [Puccinia striiformis f. sp. tritici]